MGNSRIQPARLKRLFRRLVDIYSPSGKEEEISDYLRGYLGRHGLAVTLQPVDDHRNNLIVAPEDTEIEVAFIGHLDTISAPDLDTYGYREAGDRIQGLGTADMKGGCAAMIEAFLSLKETGRENATAALCLVVGEEETGDGARQLIREYRFPWAVIGEPTDLVPCFGSYGYVEVFLGTQGRRMHPSVAERRDNAIEVLLQVMLKTTHYLEQLGPKVIYNIRDLSSSRGGFVVPERCEAWLDLHVHPIAPLGDILTELEDICIQKITGNQDIEIEFGVCTLEGGYEITDPGPVPTALEAAYNHLGLYWTPALFRSHSDANQLWSAGVKPLVLGPGRLEQAHTHNESVSFDQVRRAADLYLDLLYRLFSI